MTKSIFVEFRLRGFAKQYAAWVRARVNREAKRLKIRKLGENKFVGHISLFGGAKTDSYKRVMVEVERACRNFTLVPFKIGGFDAFQNQDANWLFLDVKPSLELEQLRWELSQNLVKSQKLINDTCKPFDRRSKYNFHTSIGQYSPGDNDKFEKLLEFAETKCGLETFRQHKASVILRLFNIIKRYVFKIEEQSYPNINLHLLRVTVLGRKNRIQFEYDLVLKKLLSRREALSRSWYRKSVARLLELFNSPKAKVSPLSNGSTNGSTYLISDTHFDHKNIIKYQHRPFSSVTEMNNAIKSNWNATIGKNDTVHFLGDWTFGWGHKPAKYWKSQLHGNILSVKGSHDGKEEGITFQDFQEIHINGYDFLLIHNPNPNDEHQTQQQKQKLENWKGWIIHGHVHGNEPFINGNNKRINMSLEVINYKPVNLSYLLSLDPNSIKRMETINSKPERW